MTTTDKTLVTFLLDRSGSMGSVRDSTIEAFNTYLGELQEETGDGADIDLTLLQFETGSLDKVYVAQPVKSVPRLTREMYVPRGGTPLIDAAYKTIKAVEAAVVERGGVSKVVVCIQTDGHENESRENTWEALRELVRQRMAEGWQFNFMGAGVDAYYQGAKMGIAAMATMSYDHLNRAATTSAFVASARNTRSFAAGASMNTNYSALDRRAAGDRFASNALSDRLAAQAVDRSVPAVDLTMSAQRVSAITHGSACRAQAIPDIKL